MTVDARDVAEQNAVRGSMGFFPLAGFDLITHDAADQALEAWGHYLGACDRPFGRQSFGLYLGLDLISVAVSASTVSDTSGGYQRTEVVELARLVTRPSDRWATRVTMRLWREIAPGCWAAKYWPVRAAVSYSNETRHKGDIYRFDGWTKVAVMPGSTGGGTYSKKQPSEPKAVWVYDLRKAVA